MITDTATKRPWSVPEISWGCSVTKGEGTDVTANAGSLSWRQACVIIVCHPGENNLPDDERDWLAAARHSVGQWAHENPY